jgi:penicillin-binding protein 1A
MTEQSRGFFRRTLRDHLPTKPWQLALVGVFTAAAVGVVVLAVVALVLTPTLPAVEDLSEKRLKVPMRVYTAEGDLMAEFGEEKRVPVRIEDVPDTLVKAILAAEDHSFFYHHGVDYLGIVRAALHNLRTRGTGQGASTITMQVARNYFLSPEKTYIRKIKEVLLAFKLERELTKKQILELYINKIFLGHRAYGFAAAAQIYYGKSLAELTLPETAMLAGLPKAPSRDNPLSNPDSALDRRNYVLRQMLSERHIDDATHREAASTPETATKHAFKFSNDAPYIAEMVRQHMFEKYDEKTYGEGFSVYTTIDTRLQKAANQALRRGLLEYERRHGYRGPAGHASIRGDKDRGRLDDALKDFRVVGDLTPGVVVKVEEKSVTVYTLDGTNVTVGWSGLAWARQHIDENTLGPPLTKAADVLKVGDIIYLEDTSSSEQNGETASRWRLAQVPQVAGAIVALRPSDGAILALTGGFDFYESKFNRVVQAERQPGSSIKPFIYTAALDKGFTAASTVSGAPIVVEDATLEDEWRPEDYSRQFFGPTRLRKALTLSLNLVSVRLLRAIGPAYAAEYLERFGFDSAKLPRNLSLALGTASATPLQMARAYTIFANGGYRIEPYVIRQVEDAEKRVLEQARPAVVCPECLETAATPSVARGPRRDPAEVQDARIPRTPGMAGSGLDSVGENTRVIAPRVLEPPLAFVMTSIMRDVIRAGTGRAALELGRKDLAGKTGTTNEYRDAWFSGFNADLVVTAWVGFDQPASLGRAETGGRAALPIWIDFMRVALDGAPERPLDPPPGIVKLMVNSETGKPATTDDPAAIEEYFIEGTEDQQPIETEPGGVTPPPAPANLPEKIRELF